MPDGHHTVDRHPIPAHAARNLLVGDEQLFFESGKLWPVGIQANAE
jgi:hypothetical protein